MDDALAQRVDALERAITDGDGDLTELTAEADAIERLETVETTVEELEERVRELEAATQALRGYVGNIRSVNEDVEQRAERALSKAEAVEMELQHRESVEATPQQRETVDGTPQHRGGVETSVAGGRADVDTETTAPAGAADTAPVSGASPGETPTSADGGTPNREPQRPESTGRCHACGRRHADDESDRSRPADRRSRTSADVEGDDGEGIVPDEETDTGTLRQIRDLL